MTEQARNTPSATHTIDLDACGVTIRSFGDWWRDWKTRMAAMIATIDPQPTPRPVYFLDFSEVRRGITVNGPPGCVTTGFVGTLYCSQFREQLEASGEWRGDGFLCALDVDALGSNLAAEGVVLHELTHDVFDRAVLRYAHAHEPNLAKLLNDGRQREPILVGTAEPQAPWRGHDWYWHRMVVHVVHRAQRLAGWRGFARTAVQFDYGLRAVHDYAHALGDEPEQMLDAPLEEVRESPPSERFIHFAAQDQACARLLLAASDEQSVRESTVDAPMDVVRASPVDGRLESFDEHGLAQVHSLHAANAAGRGRDESRMERISRTLCVTRQLVLDQQRRRRANRRNPLALYRPIATHHRHPP